MTTDKKELLANLCAINKLYVHDFKNPVSALVANLNYLEAVIDDPDTREAVTDSNLAVKNLLHLLENFLNISRLEAGELRGAEPFFLPRLVNESMGKCLGLFAVMEPALVLDANIPEVEGQWNPQVARLALDNLILAAIANTPSAGRVTLTVNADGENVTFTITDTGIPISEQNAARSFERDFQLISKTDKDSRYGRGMGMYAAGLAATTLGGTVSTFAPATGGQCTVLTLPLQPNQ